MKQYIWWRLKNAIFRITHPHFWIQNHRTSYKWDYALNRLLASDLDVDVVAGGHLAKIGDMKVWVANYPYCFGHPNNPFAAVLPAPLTRRKLKRIVGVNAIKPEDEAVSAVEKLLRGEK